jgi:hypothetical protein
MNALSSKKLPDSDRVFTLRRYLIGFFFVVIFHPFGPYSGLLAGFTWDKRMVSARGHCSGFIDRHGPTVRAALLVGWTH